MGCVSKNTFCSESILGTWMGRMEAIMNLKPKSGAKKHFTHHPEPFQLLEYQTDVRSCMFDREIDPCPQSRSSHRSWAVSESDSSGVDSAAVSVFVVILVELTNTETAVVSPPSIGLHRIFNQFSLAPISVQRFCWLHQNWSQWELVEYFVWTNESASAILVQAWSSGFKDYKWKCPSQRLNIDWNELKTISVVNLHIWEG